MEVSPYTRGGKKHVFQTASTSMGIPLDGAGRGGGGLGGTEGGATGREWSTEKGVGRVGAEHTGVIVVDRSVD